MNTVLKYKTPLFYLLSFIFGVTLSSGLLSFERDGYVNVFYFLAFVVVIPFFISLFSLLFKRAYKVSSLGGVFFSLGALFSILFIFAFKFVAFGWSSTMDISADGFYHFLSYFAFWKVFCPKCVPSLELVKLSHYPFVKDIDKVVLGGWWKFLAMSVFVYGVLFRFLIYLFSLFIKPKNIEFVSKSDEEEFKEVEIDFENKSEVESLKDRKFRLLGYYVDMDKLDIKSFDDAKDIVIAVKSYEPPIMDFFDYLDEVMEENPTSKISLLMIGLEKPQEKDVDMWIRKLNELGYKEIEVLS
jgi:hypothetical protein